MKHIAHIRKSYEKGELEEASAHNAPLDQFRHWFQQALDAGVPEPNAMTLATVSADGQPSTRTMLLKGFDSRGFSFFTNHLSRKGRELAGNAKAALTIYWKERERQVCVRGTVSMLSREESGAYFQSRPYGSQIGAWVSQQSERIPGRAPLEGRERELLAEYPEGKVPLPPNWGGYVVSPHEMEFWQGRASRLHDRILFERQGDKWARCRLSP